MSEAKVIDGKAIAAVLREHVAVHVARLKEEYDVKPCLAVVLVGSDPASRVYVVSKQKMTVAAGMESREHLLPEDASEAELMAVIEELNNDKGVNGILCQLPLPDHMDAQKVIASINVEKDVDGFHVDNVGRLWTGGDSLIPCTPWGSLMMLKQTLGDLTGKRAIIVGRSNIVGKPMAALLLEESCTVTIAHSRTIDLAKRVKEADIVIAAVGRPEMIKGDWIKPGATVIDVGINRIENGKKEDGTTKYRLVGDVEYKAAAKVAGAITPVPGGVGPMTIACLLRNTVVAASRQHGLHDPDF